MRHAEEFAKPKTMRFHEPKLVLPITFKFNIPINLPYPPPTSPHVEVFTFTCTLPSTIINLITIGDDLNVQKNDKKDHFLDGKEDYED